MIDLAGAVPLRKASRSHHAPTGRVPCGTGLLLLRFRMKLVILPPVITDSWFFGHLRSNGPQRGRPAAPTTPESLPVRPPAGPCPLRSRRGFLLLDSLLLHPLLGLHPHHLLLHRRRHLLCRLPCRLLHHFALASVHTLLLLRSLVLMVTLGCNTHRLLHPAFSRRSPCWIADEVFSYCHTSSVFLCRFRRCSDRAKVPSLHCRFIRSDTISDFKHPQERDLPLRNTLPCVLALYPQSQTQNHIA